MHLSTSSTKQTRFRMHNLHSSHPTAHEARPSVDAQVVASGPFCICGPRWHWSAELPNPGHWLQDVRQSGQKSRSLIVSTLPYVDIAVASRDGLCRGRLRVGPIRHAFLSSDLAPMIGWMQVSPPRERRFASRRSASLVAGAKNASPSRPSTRRIVR
jgi:hypothetical protein